MASRSALLVVNRLSRQGESELSSTVRRLADGGVTVTMEVVVDPQSMFGLIDTYAKTVDTVIVAGGDGTLNAAVDGLAAHRLTLGILPLGTANDLARTLSIPLSLDEACDVIVAGHLHSIDLGWVNDKLFFNVASIGLSVRIAQKLTAEVKRRWGLLSYAISAARALRTSAPFRAEIRCNGKAFPLWAVQIAVGNGRHYGGGMTIAEGATIEDGLLHLYAIKPRSLFRYLAMLPALRRGQHKDWPGVQVAEGAEIEIVTRPSLPINTDGEVTGRTPGRFRVIPRALPVMVPERYILGQQEGPDAER